jgi:hypothetical protein
MSTFPRNPNSPASDSACETGTVEATLRLIASLPAPEGLEDRVQAALHAAPRKARVLAWPVLRSPQAGWVRAAAAATIAFVVAGGGWGVYSHVQPAQPAGAKAVPAHISPQSGFSSAGAMRTPQTLNGPVAPAVAAQPAHGALKSPKKPAQAAVNRGKAAEKKTAAALPASNPPK